MSVRFKWYTYGWEYIQPMWVFSVSYVERASHWLVFNKKVYDIYKRKKGKID